MKSSWFCPVTHCSKEPKHKLSLPSPQVDGDLLVLCWGVKCVQILAKIIPLCDIFHPSPWRERMAQRGTRVYCMNPLPLSPLAPIKHWASPTSPHSLLSLQLLHHWFKCLTGACRTPTSLHCKLAWGDGSHCAHKTHKTQWKFQPWDNDPNFHEPIKQSKKLAGRLQDHAYLCRITCHLGREAERRM